VSCSKIYNEQPKYSDEQLNLAVDSIIVAIPAYILFSLKCFPGEKSHSLSASLQAVLGQLQILFSLFAAPKQLCLPKKP
jgi:hypothetical protein